MNDLLSELDNELDDMTSSKKVNISTEKNKTSTEKSKKEDVKVNIQKKELPQRKPNLNKNNSNNPWDRNNAWSFQSKVPSVFPDVKFYLPTLRDGYTRFMPIGWNNETGSKNMWMAQYGDDIVIIDCWIQFADNDMLWVSYSVPDVSFLTKYKKNIKWMILTHGHLDHIGTLKHVLPAIGMPPLYWTKLTLGLAKKWLEEAWLLNKVTFIEIDAWSTKDVAIWPFNVEFFRVNHSIPDCAGFCMKSPGWAKFVHTWDFKIDHTPAIDEPADLERIEWIWKKWVTLFLSDSTGSPRKGFSKSEKEVW